MALIDIRALSYAYEQAQVLEQVDLHVEAGAFLAIIGPNGGGKTTLLRLMLGLLQPQQGEIRIFGQAPRQVQRRIGYVPQHSRTTAGFPVSVEDVVRMGLSGLRRTPRQTRLAIEQALAKAGMLESAAARLDELSGGQQQRVLLARALVSEPELLLLDEPLANVDPYGRQCIVETLMALVPRPTIVMVSHDLGLSAHAVDSMAAVNRYLIHRQGRTLSPDMIRLMYGLHDEGCLHWPEVTS